MLYSLSNCIVRLSSFGVFEMAYVHLDNEGHESRVLLRDKVKEWFVVNIDTGILTKDRRPFGPIITPYERMTNWYVSEGVKLISDESDHVDRHVTQVNGKTISLEVTNGSDDLVRVVATLISHQVEGDRILKSLKALGYDYSGWKVTEVYVGGWIFEQGKDRKGSSTFLTGLV